MEMTRQWKTRRKPEMKFIGVLLLVSVVLSCFIPATTCAQKDSLKARIEFVIDRAGGRVGVAVLGLDNNDTLMFNGDGRFPMQSVYKFPLALTVLHEVDAGKFAFDQRIHITKADLLPKTWSPLRDKYPEGDVDLSLAEVLTYTVSESDNNGCDILFRLLGGPKTVDAYLHGLGITDIAVVATEEEMHKGWDVQYRNWSSPLAMARLLSMFYHGQILSPKSRGFLWRAMVETGTGPRRIKGLLPEGTLVAHKTGSSGINDSGITAATNDAGIVALPNGSHVAIVVFVSDARSEETACEDVIAEIARAVWDASAVH
jgi:beta-lactamase class A